MKRAMVLLGLTTVACGRQEVIQEPLFVIDDPSSTVVVDGTSKLKVPSSCPIYAAGAGDRDTPEPALNGGVTAVCAVDDAGATYGLILGDIPIPTGLPVLPGRRELGIYVGFEPWEGHTPIDVVLTGDNPTIAAWAAPINISNGSTDCCADQHPDKRIPVNVVASGPHGILFSVGTFDGMPTQVAYTVQAPAVFSYNRFYVNGQP